MKSLWTRYDRSPTLTAVAQSWSSCMRVAGSFTFHRRLVLHSPSLLACRGPAPLTQPRGPFGFQAEALLEVNSTDMASKRNHNHSPLPSTFQDGSSSAELEKSGRSSPTSLSSWSTSSTSQSSRRYLDYTSLPIPFTQRRLTLPYPRMRSARPLLPAGTQKTYHSSSHHDRAGTSGLLSLVRRRPCALITLIVVVCLLLVNKIKTGRNLPQMPFVDDSTLILNKSDLLRIWKYEVESGRHPSRLMPAALPNQTVSRRYLELEAPDAYSLRPATAEQLAYPPRPTPKAAIDLDIVMEHCDYGTGKYVRDCLEMLRMGAGLDPQNRLRRGDKPGWRHMFRDEKEVVGAEGGRRVQYDPDYVPEDVLASLGVSSPQKRSQQPLAVDAQRQPPAQQQQEDEVVDFELPRSFQPPPAGPRRVGAGKDRSAHPMHLEADPACDPENPQIFHIFWAGPFTDKPYLAALSFLFTQNLGLNYPIPDQAHDFGKPLTNSPRDRFLSKVCRPQLHIWINPGAAAAVPDPTARDKMFASLAANEWSAPLLHKRFEEVIKFNLWNTTEQLDGIPELRDHWRSLPLFNSGGVKYNNVPKNKTKKPEPKAADNKESDPAAPSPTDNSSDDDSSEDEMYARVGSLSSSGYDRLSVVLSDMARFVLTHRFGGIYLDADTLLLRDWEPLFQWSGAFGYRWSRLEKYNTAVLKMRRNTALGSMLFKTALANGLDFHPMTISRYSQDAGFEALLRRLPDALFDPAWLKYVVANVPFFL